ncbi:unnamed protein product [Fraxinus pennsylvanica]|uniref:SANT domain-containing protein n=1 Tax=Fraxinus pennsylvanica TaxID=56036 RepID=A0AAD2DKV0_9LAMI|nr:unnamed protein product [Fraxinus pennsylvanica]
MRECGTSNFNFFGTQGFSSIDQIETENERWLRDFAGIVNGVSTGFLLRVLFCGRSSDTSLSNSPNSRGHLINSTGTLIWGLSWILWTIYLLKTLRKTPGSVPVPTSDVIERESSFHRDDQRNSISVTLSSQNIVTIDRPNTTAGLVSDPDVVMPDGNCSWQSNFDKSGENRDIILGLELLDDFLPHATADMETIAEGSTPSEAASADVPSTKNAGLPVHSSIDASTCPQQSVVQDPLTGGEPIISISYDGDHMDNRVVETEEMDIMDTQVLSDLATSFGWCSRKFQPKPKIQMQNQIHEASTTYGLESASCLQDSQSIPSEINFGDKCSNPAFSQDDVLDLSAMGFTHAIPSESMPELIADEDPINLVETSQLNSGFPVDHPEVVPEMSAELSQARTRKGKTRTSVPSPEQQNASTSGQKNEAGRSLRPRKIKRNLFQLVDEFDDEFHVDGEFPAECPSSSVAGEDNISGKKFQVENESQTKKVKRNSVKPLGDKEKPAGKWKKAKETSDQPAKSKPKMLSHSTLKRRRVDKFLLETPEDEIDFQKVPLRDLILLAEQLQKKEATTEVPSTNQSNVNPSENYNEDEPFVSEQDGEYDRGQESHRVEESNIYFNYQTYMDRTPRVRWSKQDTELFYEAIRQFGTDLSMIQQLFPGRTRNQVKLKYKKEERKHPMRLREALTTRTKDHSHFEKVIEHLQQIAAEENQNGNKDDSIDLTVNEDAEEGSHEANKGELKTERGGGGGGENEDTAQEFTEIQSPMKSCDSEDDLSISGGNSNSRSRLLRCRFPFPRDGVCLTSASSNKKSISVLTMSHHYVGYAEIVHEMEDIDNDMDDESQGRDFSGSESDLDEYDYMNNRMQDISAAQVRSGRDIQGIPWGSLGITRERYRKTRLEHYNNYENIPQSGEGLEKECKITKKGSSYYEFRHNSTSVKSTILHLQLRNLVWPTSKHDVYFMSQSSVMHWSSLTCKKSEVLNVSGHVAPSTTYPGSLLDGFTKIQVSTLAVKDNLLVVGGFQGELICKYLDRPGICFSTRTTDDDNAITNAVEIYTSSSGAIHFIASANDCGVRDFDMETLKSKLTYFPWPVNHTSLCPNSKLLIIVGDDPDGMLVDSSSAKIIARLRGHKDHSFASAWHPDGVTFATGNQDKTCRIWDTRNLSRSIATLKGNLGAIRSIRYTFDGRFMAMAEAADFVHVFDTKSGYEEEQEINFFGEISGMSFSPDTESLFIGVWDRTYGSLLEYGRSRDYSYIDAII